MAATNKDEIKTLTTHYIDGAFVELHGREVMDTDQADQWQGDRARHASRRGGYAARRRRCQARLRDLWPVDKGRTRRAFAPAACGRLGARRRADGGDGGRVRRCRAVRRTDCTVRRRRVSGSGKGACRDGVDTQLGQDDGDPGAGRRRRTDYRVECECTVCLPQARLRRRRGLHRRNQAQRVKLVADAGFDRGAP